MPLLTYEQAEALAVAHINDWCGKDQAVVLFELTIVKPYGWVFFYLSREYVETGDFRSILVGNSPLIVDREEGRVHVTGTAWPVEYYIAAYEASRTRPNLLMRRTGATRMISLIHMLLGRGSSR